MSSFWIARDLGVTRITPHKPSCRQLFLVEYPRLLTTTFTTVAIVPQQLVAV
jgi:hypothetical protein